MIPIAKPYVTNDEAKAAHDTILTGWITQGPKVAEFENEKIKIIDNYIEENKINFNTEGLKLSTKLKK